MSERDKVCNFFTMDDTFGLNIVEGDSVTLCKFKENKFSKDIYVSDRHLLLEITIHKPRTDS